LKQYKEDVIKTIEKFEQDDFIDVKKLQRIEKCKEIISNLEKNIKVLEDFGNKNKAVYNNIVSGCVNEK